MSPVAVAQYSSDAIRYVLPVLGMTSLSYNAGNKPELKTIHMFSPFRQLATPEAKSTVYRLHLVVYTVVITTSGTG